MIKKFFTSRFGKSILVVTGGTAFAQSLNIILSPIITRIYTPDEYGVLTAFSAILTLLTLGAFKYELAIPISRDEKTAANVLALSIVILSLFVLILILVLVLFSRSLIGLFTSEILYNFRFLLPVGVFIAGLYIVLKQWAFRNKDFKTISKTTINQSVFSNLIKIAAGLMGLGSLGLIVGRIIGQSSGIRVLIQPLIKQKEKIWESLSYRELLYCFKRFRDFPIYNSPSAFLISLSGNLPIVFLTTIYGSSVVGYYGLAYTIVKLPMNLLGNAVADVFYAEAASMGKENPKRLKENSSDLLKKLFIIGMLPLAILLMFGPHLFSLLFGESWSVSGEYARIISIMLFFMFVFTPFGKIYIVFEKQKIRFLLNTLRVLLILIVFLITWYFSLNSYIAVSLYSSAMSVSYFLMYVIANKIMKDKIKYNL